MLALGAFTYTVWCLRTTTGTQGSSLLPVPQPERAACPPLAPPPAGRAASKLGSASGKMQENAQKRTKCKAFFPGAPCGMASLGLPTPRALFHLIKKGPGGGVGAHGGLWVVPVRRPHPRREQRVQAVPGQRSRSQSELLFRKNLSGGRESCGAGLGAQFLSC